MKLQFAIILAGLLSLSVAQAAPWSEESPNEPIGLGAGSSRGFTQSKRAIPTVMRPTPSQDPQERLNDPIHLMKRRAIPFGERGIKIDDPTTQYITPAQYRRGDDEIRLMGDYQSTVGSKPPASGIGLPPRTGKPPGGGAGRSFKRDIANEDYASLRDDYQSQTGGNPGPGHWLPPPDPKARSGGGVRSGKRDLTDEDLEDYAWLREDYQSKANEPKQGGSPGHWLPGSTGKPPGCTSCRTGKRDLTEEDAADDVWLRSDDRRSSSEPRSLLPPPTGMRPVRDRARMGRRDLVDMQVASDYVLSRDLVQKPPSGVSNPGGGPDQGAVENPGGRRGLNDADSAGGSILSRDTTGNKPFGAVPRAPVDRGGEAWQDIGPTNPVNPGHP
ncbi:hypothetical protein BCV69DRAFT_66550 [Microstroma glucosiphilum]|uniref:Uncharacterized protein n=1 Tax=Pseudomicrostroma glucosiphilum TaxID=1684307 RepID=A0A316TZC0_9BASI|nr:hypothetical protein BCV69DRAFT_66550 [Pseudomicrostroma glucosiphilum]PWN18569.1 hypothetical protein BCV69DRAFT_66550 [Pseudomicrostroma glucosiphilum]